MGSSFQKVLERGVQPSHTDCLPVRSFLV